MLHASFRRSVALTPLRFAPLAVASSGEDFHLQVGAHAGHTIYYGCYAASVSHFVRLNPLQFGGSKPLKSKKAQMADAVWAFLRAREIGIGAPGFPGGPLPHHQAYGSVLGGSSS